jgi:hypothetical protein
LKPTQQNTNSLPHEYDKMPCFIDGKHFEWMQQQLSLNMLEIGVTILDASYLFLRDGIVYFLYKVLIAEFLKVITKLHQIRHG